MSKAHQVRTFAVIVREQIAATGMTISGLARRMGASPQALIRILTRDNPRMGTVLRVAHALGCDPRELVP